MIADAAAGTDARHASSMPGYRPIFVVRAFDLALGATLFLLRFSPVEIALIRESAGFLTAYAKPALKGLSVLRFGRTSY